PCQGSLGVWDVLHLEVWAAGLQYPVGGDDEHAGATEHERATVVEASTNQRLRWRRGLRVGIVPAGVWIVPVAPVQVSRVVGITAAEDHVLVRTPDSRERLSGYKRLLKRERSPGLETTGVYDVQDGRGRRTAVQLVDRARDVDVAARRPCRVERVAGYPRHVCSRHVAGPRPG